MSIVSLRQPRRRPPTAVHSSVQVRCRLTGHEMPCTQKAVSEYRQGSRYRLALKRLGTDQALLDLHSTHFTLLSRSSGLLVLFFLHDDSFPKPDSTQLKHSTTPMFYACLWFSCENLVVSLVSSGLMHCKLTGREVKNVPAEVERHVKGHRFKQELSRCVFLIVCFWLYFYISASELSLLLPLLVHPQMFKSRSI